MISPTIAQFLSLIAHSEGTSTEDITANDGYDVIVTGEVEGANGKLLRHEEVFTDYSQHPFAGGRPAVEIVPPGARFPKGLYSTASGRYQIILPTWKDLQARLSLPDFTPASQDAACVALLPQHAVLSILAGDIQGAIEACSGIWASLPGNNYGQGGHTMGNLLEVWPTLAVSS